MHWRYRDKLYVSSAVTFYVIILKAYFKSHRTPGGSILEKRTAVLLWELVHAVYAMSIVSQPYRSNSNLYYFSVGPLLTHSLLNTFVLNQWFGDCIKCCKSHDFRKQCFVTSCFQNIFNIPKFCHEKCLMVLTDLESVL